MDAFSEKMSNMATYSYNFNNPLRFIDSDGNEPKDIILILQRDSQGNVTSRVRYYQGQLYNPDGTKYEFDMMGHFASRTQTALNNVRSADSYLEKIVSTLESSEAGNHYIEFTSNTEKNNNVKGIGNRGSTIMKLKYESIKSGFYESGEKKTFETILTHELSHQYDRETGGRDFKWKGNRPENNPNEIRAVNLENRYRYNRGIELRKHYLNKINEEKLEDPKLDKK